MKNLNRKLSVIALSGMAVFGGVAVSGVQAFAAGNGVAVEQQAQDKVVEDLQREIRKAGYGGIYQAIESGNKNVLLKKAEKLAENSRFFFRGSMSVSSKNPKKSLERILGQRQDALVVKFQGKYVLIQDVIHN